MITEKDLQEAIAECNGQRNPNATTCIKLAAYYTIYDHLFPHNAPDVTVPDIRTSGASPLISYDGESDFAKAVRGKDIEDIMPVMDELMMTLQAMNPRLYNGVMKRL
jgi:hypothetical protein